MKNYDLNAILEAAGFFAGQLLTPATTMHLFSGERLEGFDIGGYVIAATVSTAMLNQARANPRDAGWRMTAFETPNSQMLLTLSVQAGRYQTRFVLPLANPVVKDMLRSYAVTQKWQLLLTTPCEDTILRFTPKFYSEDLAPLLLLAAENRALCKDETIKEVAVFASQLGKVKDRIVCGDMPTPLKVTMVSIIPTA